jgi:hypothetical protein
MSQPNFVPISSNQLGGAIAVNVFAVLSALALVSVVLRIAWLAIHKDSEKSRGSHEYVFFNTQLGRYAACLIIATMFNAVSGIIGLQWYVQQGIMDAWPCKVQATIMQIGNFSTGYFTAAIAVHTFNSLILRMRQSFVIWSTTIATGWILATLVGVAPLWIHRQEGYVYGPNGLGCGVRQVYPKLQFIFHILPILLASLVGTILYSLIFLVLRGTLEFKRGIKITLNPNERWNNSEGLGENYHRFVARVAKSMLWYPVAYVALLIPYAVTRLFQISGFAVPFEAVVFAQVCWYGLSVVDVLLLYNTFRVLGPAFDARSAASGLTTQKNESFGTSGYLEKYSSSHFGQRSDMEKINHYRSQSSSFGSRPSEQSFYSADAHSIQPLLPLYMGRDVPEFQNTMQPDPSILGRSITPSSVLSWEVVQPPHAVSPSRSPTCGLPRHIRTDSLTSIGLPAPPRRTRSPVLTQPLPQLKIPKKAENEPWMIRQTSTQTFGRRNSGSQSAKSPSISLFSVDSERSSKTPRQGDMTVPPTLGQPMLSAVSSSFPKSPLASHQGRPSHRRSPSAHAVPPTPSRHRPLLSHSGSLDVGLKARSASEHPIAPF